MNQYDTQVIREEYQRQGFREITGPGAADIYVINTCTVTASADKKSRYYINHAHRENPEAKVIVSGCYAQLDKKTVGRIPGVTGTIKLPKELKSVSGFQGHTRAFLKIQDGCDNSCAYCKVHIVRGRSRSKFSDKILAEAKALVESGFKEIVLCGVCLGAYGKDLTDKPDLVKVIKLMEKLKGLERIRLSSLEAWDITNDLINHMTKSTKLSRHLHIPIQSGDDKILKAMNRRASFQLYLDLIKHVQEKVPDVAITTDIMVGFPGETDKNFDNTMKLLKLIKPLRIHIFPYSPRPGTKAANLPEAVDNMTMTKRLDKLKALAVKYETAFLRSFINRKMPVLFEDRVKEDERYWEGHTDNYLKVWAKVDQDLRNNILLIKLKKISGEHIVGDKC